MKTKKIMFKTPHQVAVKRLIDLLDDRYIICLHKLDALSKLISLKKDSGTREELKESYRIELQLLEDMVGMITEIDDEMDGDEEC